MSGKPIATEAPYGYIKAPDNKDFWIIDEEAAEVVRLIFRLFFYRLCDFAILRHIHAVLLRQTHNLINQTIHLGLLAGFHIALHRGRRGRCKRIQNAQIALDQLPRPALQRNTHLVRQRNDLFYQAYKAVAHLARMLHFRSFCVIILSAGRIR